MKTNHLTSVGNWKTMHAKDCSVCEHFPAVVFSPILSEIPGFLSEEECRVVVQLAQLKGLMESQMIAPGQGQQESNQPLLSLSTEEVFSLLDLNQDGLLQKHEVTREKQI